MGKFKGTKEELEKAYVSDPCATRVAIKFGVSKNCILFWLKKYNISIIKCGGRNVKDLTGQKIGKLFIIKKVINETSRTEAKWFCQCDCGKTKVISGRSLYSGLTTSCGCHRRNKLWKGYGDLSHVYWHRILKGAKSRNLDVDITIQEVWDLYLTQNKKCAISGLDIKIVSNYTVNHKEHTASLDRVDCSKGYIKGNVQWVHRDINIMRNNWTVEEFIYYCKKVTEYNGN